MQIMAKGFTRRFKTAVLKKLISSIAGDIFFACEQ